MSRGTPDTGDNNPFASGRIARTVLLMFVVVLALWVLGRMVGVAGSAKETMAAIAALLGLARDNESDGDDEDASDDEQVEKDKGAGEGPGRRRGGAKVKGGAQIQKAFLGNGGLVTVAQAQEVVTMLIRMQQAIEGLPEEERTKAREERDKLASELFKARMKAYLAAPPAKRRAELDRQIGQDEVMRRAWKASRTQGSRTKAAGEGFPGGGGWPGDGGPGGSEEEQSRHLKNFLDSTSPEQRARYEEYRRAMEARRQQLRLPP